VKLGVHEDDGQQVAVKCMDKNDIKAQEMTMNVRREIAIMKALKHKNIVNMLQVLSSSTKLYIVMELVAGGELFTKILNDGKLPEAVARRYFQSVVDGVDYCHARGVCHRDLKPENLLIEQNTGYLKITDFGLSALRGGANTAEELLHTQCGSPNYCAPEIISSAKKGYDGVMVDVWACGIILFALLAGYLPFYDDNTSKLYKMIQFEGCKYPRKFPAGAKDLCERLLTKDPKRRITLSEVKRHAWFLVDYDGDGVLKGSLAPVQAPPPVEKLKVLPPPKPRDGGEQDEDSDEEERKKKEAFKRDISQRLNIPSPEEQAAAARKPAKSKAARNSKPKDPLLARAEQAVAQYERVFDVKQNGDLFLAKNVNKKPSVPGSALRGRSIAAAAYVSIKAQLNRDANGEEVDASAVTEGTLGAFEKLLQFFEGKKVSSSSAAASREWWNNIPPLSDSDADALEGLCQMLEVDPEEGGEDLEDVGGDSMVPLADRASSTPGPSAMPSANSRGSASTPSAKAPMSKSGRTDRFDSVASTDESSGAAGGGGGSGGSRSLHDMARRVSSSASTPSAKRASGIAKILGIGAVHTLETDLSPERALREIGKILTVSGYQVLMKRGDATKMKVELKGSSGDTLTVGIHSEKRATKTVVSFRKSAGRGDLKLLDDLFNLVEAKYKRTVKQ